MGDMVPEQDNGSQFREVLGNLQPLLNLPGEQIPLGESMTDKGRRPSGEEEERPWNKRAKGGPKKEARSDDSSDHSAVLRTLTSLVLRLDRDMAILHHQSTHLFYMSQDSRGAQIHLLKQADQWRERIAAQEQLPPLRCHLASALFQELLNRLQKIAALEPTHATIVNLKKQRILTENAEWPFLQWNHQTRSMEQSKRKPLKMKDVGQLLEEMVEHLTCCTVIQKFQALRTTSETQDVPWLMQFSLRANSAWEVMTALSQCSVWTIIGTTTKVHSQSQSRQADRLIHQMYPNSQPKGGHKGRGKGAKGNGTRR